jgi:CRP-like cAMP-binding protein
VDVKAGDYIFREGELGTEMFIIHDGRVEVLQKVGEEEKCLAVFEKGDFFGEMSLLEDLPRAASVRALSDVRLLQINGATFSQMLRDNPEIAVRMMRKLSRRMRETDRLLREALHATGAPPKTAPDVPTPEPPRHDEEGDEAAVPERLIHDKSGMEFVLSRGSETSIGRRDPVTGIYPDIDLTPVDAQRSISRRHAKIYRRGKKYFLSEEIGTMNGTFCNGLRLETGVPTEIKPGDEVRLGMVVTEFQVQTE